MQASPLRQSHGHTPSPITTVLVGYRIWIYLILLMVAITLLVLDQRLDRSATPSTEPSSSMKLHGSATEPNRFL